MAVGPALLARQADGASPLRQFAAALLVFGVGFGLALTPGTALVIDGLPADRRTLAAAVNDVTREVGGALGGAVAASVLRQQPGPVTRAPVTAPPGTPAPAAVPPAAVPVTVPEPVRATRPAPAPQPTTSAPETTTPPAETTIPLAETTTPPAETPPADGTTTAPAP